MKAVIFDFFGTLVDYKQTISAQSYPETFKALSTLGYNGTYSTFEKSWEEVIVRFESESKRSLNEYQMFDAMKFLLDNMSIGYHEPTIDNLVHLFIKEWSKGIVYKKDIKNFLFELKKNFQLALISNTNYPPLVTTHIEAMNIAVIFTTITLSAQFGRRKPHPSIFEKTLESMDL